jgi:hypothetical protein
MLYRYFLILFLFIDYIGFCQYRIGSNVKANLKNSFDKNHISGGDASLVLLFDSDNVTKSGLTYNSTGDTIVWISNDNVVVDSTDHIIIGNSIRFGNAESGTIYTILDTLGSIDSLKLDQDCTANIGDEFFIGCDGLIVDQSSYGNNGTQTIGAYQPKGIWIETDSSRWFLEGDDDYISSTSGIDASLIDITYCIWFRVFDNTINYLFGVSGVGVSTAVGLIMDVSSTGRIRTRPFGVSSTNSTNGFNDGEWHFAAHLIDRDGNATLYVDNIQESQVDISSRSENELNTSSWHIGNEGSQYAYMEFDEVRIYIKLLSESERDQLYQSSKHYNP